jgi:hypothetical protein
MQIKSFWPPKGPNFGFYAEVSPLMAENDVGIML